MGQAKRRQKEIAELKAKGPKPRLRLKKTYPQIGTELHFVNEAAWRQVLTDHPEATTKLSTLAGRIEAVKEFGLAPRLFRVVNIKGVRLIPLAKRQAKKLRPITLVTKRPLSHDEFLIHALAMAQINPAGFRQPSNKEKNYKSTSLMERISQRMDVSKPRVAPERSKRGQKKVEAQQQTKALIYLERLIRDNPGKTAQWLFGKTMAAMDGEVDHDWLKAIIPDRIKIVSNLDYLHAIARRYCFGIDLAEAA